MASSKSVEGKPVTKDSLLRATMRTAVDAWQNIVTGLGTAAKDKRLGGRIVAPAVAAAREQYEILFTSDDIAARVVELPAREMVREWITLTTEDDGGNDGQKKEALEERVNLTKEALNKLDTLKARSMLSEALVWSKVHGGSLMFLGVDDGSGDDLTQPLNKESIRSFDFLNVFDRWDVNINTRYPFGHEKVGQPETYMLNAQVTGGQGGTSPIVHETRFIRFDGTLTSKQRIRENGGWSDSVYVRLEAVLRDFGITWGGVANLLQDFAQAVFKMKGLKDAIASDNDDLVLTRIAIMDMCRGIGRAVPIDADDEDFQRMTTPVSGLADLLDRFAQRLAAAAEMPITLLMGQSPAGMNATGESDITNWFNQISNRQETQLRDPVELLIQLVWLSADGPTRGKEPDSWSFFFNPLWQLDRKEEAQTRKTNAEGDKMMIEMSVLSPEEVAQSRYGGDAYGDEITLDVKARQGDMLTQVDIDAAIEAAKAEATAAAGADPAVTVPSDAGNDGSITARDALNGGQVTSMVTLAQEVQAGKLPRESALAIMLAAFPIDEPTAQKILPVEGSKKPEPVPAAFGQPPATPPNPNDDPDNDDRDDAHQVTTSEDDGHAHELALPPGTLVGPLVTSTVNGHHHSVKLRKPLEPGHGGFFMTDFANGHNHSVEVIPRRADDFNQDRIEKRGNKYVVLSSNAGEVLGEHDTKKEAEAQLAAVEASKARRK